MISKKKRIVILGILAFAVATYIFLRKDIGADGKGLRRFKVESVKRDSGWGYRIFKGKTPIVEQLTIPGVSGTDGFKDEASALKTGKLVEKKLESGIFPPSVSQQELDSLGIKY